MIQPLKREKKKYYNKNRFSQKINSLYGGIVFVRVFMNSIFVPEK